MPASNPTSVQNAPLRLETLKSYARDIFAPIKRGESVSTIWIPMVGRRVRNKYIISYPDLFKDEIGDKKYLLVYVEPLELTEESNAGYIKLIIKSTLDSSKEQTSLKLDETTYFDSSAPYDAQLANLERLVKEVNASGAEIILFLGEFDEFSFASTILYNNLKSLWTKADGKLHYIFLLLENVTSPEAIKKYGELNSLLLKNVIYVPLTGQDDATYLMDYFGKELNRDFSDEEKGLLFKLCRGHPFLLKSCTRLIALMNGHKLELNELEETLTTHFEPRSVTQKIFDTLSHDEQESLRQVVAHPSGSLPKEAQTLDDLGLVNKDKDGNWVPFGKLLESVVTDGKVMANGAFQPPTSGGGEGGLVFDPQSGAIFIAGANVEEKFTRQEYEILRFLLEEPDKLHSREEVGEAMWGKASYDKYSDWAIDQVMSKIRKKLHLLGLDHALATVRGRGYKLILNP